MPRLIKGLRGGNTKNVEYHYVILITAGRPCTAHYHVQGKRTLHIRIRESASTYNTMNSSI